MTFEPCVRDKAKRDELFASIKRRFREEALVCHPDRCDDAAKIEDFKRLSAVYTDLENFFAAFQPPPPRPPQARVMWRTPFTPGASTTVSTNLGAHGIPYMVFIRV